LIGGDLLLLGSALASGFLLAGPFAGPGLAGFAHSALLAPSLDGSALEGLPLLGLPLAGRLPLLGFTPGLAATSFLGPKDAQRARLGFYCLLELTAALLASGLSSVLTLLSAQALAGKVFGGLALLGALPLGALPLGALPLEALPLEALPLGASFPHFRNGVSSAHGGGLIGA